jgi:hypothetical protein
MSRGASWLGTAEPCQSKRDQELTSCLDCIFRLFFRGGIILTGKRKLYFQDVFMNAVHAPSGYCIFQICWDFRPKAATCDNIEGFLRVENNA